MPEATASSTTYCTSGLSISGSISLGDDFVAGRKRVPRPATGKIAFLTMENSFMDLTLQSYRILFSGTGATAATGRFRRFGLWTVTCIEPAVTFQAESGG